MCGNTKIRNILLSISVLFCISCSHNQYLPDSQLEETAVYLLHDPLPTPEFVISVPRSNPDSGTQCIQITQRPFWNQQFLTDEISEHLIDSIQLAVDNQVIAEAEVTIMVARMAYPIFKDNGEILGLYGGPITVCFNIGEVGLGSHVASLELSDMTGNPYSYMWAFEVSHAKGINPQRTRQASSLRNQMSTDW